MGTWSLCDLRAHRLFLVGVLANYLHPAYSVEAIDDLRMDTLQSTRYPIKPVPHTGYLDRTITTQIIDSYRNGASTYVLAKRHGVRRNTVRDLLRRAGFDTAANGKTSSLGDSERRELYRLKTEGLTRRDLAQAFQVSESTVKRVLAMHTNERIPEVDRARTTRKKEGLVG